MSSLLSPPCKLNGRFLTTKRNTVTEVTLLTGTRLALCTPYPRPCIIRGISRTLEYSCIIMNKNIMQTNIILFYNVGIKMHI